MWLLVFESTAFVSKSLTVGERKLVHTFTFSIDTIPGSNKETQPFQLGSSSLSKNPPSSRRKKKLRNSPNEATPGEEEPSLLTSFGGNNEKSSPRTRTSFESIIITDALTDVRQRYHINPKE